MVKTSESAGGFPSRTSETYALIREDVISGKFPPGSKLKIEQLSRSHQVGATPVREALSCLAADGLVVREDQRGFRVADVSTAEFEELLNVRCFVENRALRLAIEHGDKTWEENIVLARYRLSRVPRPTGYGAEWERCHKSFHLSLVAACGSRMLLRLCGQFHDENNRYRYISRLEPSQDRDVRAEHESIAEAVLGRDPDLATALLTEHYRKTGEVLRIALRDLRATGAR